jgi:hypothetical protein
MLHGMRSRLSSAHVIALIALFVALGGTGYAAVKLPKNSVGASQIKTNGVGSSEVKNGALRKADFKASDLPVGAQGPQGLQGLQGQKGDKGDKGDKGETGNLGQTTVQFTQAAADLGNGAETSIDAQCPEGQQGIGGGARGDLTNSELTKITASRPIISATNAGAPADDGTFTGWRGTFVNENNGAGIRPEVWVICADAPPAPAP